VVVVVKAFADFSPPGILYGSASAGQRRAPSHTGLGSCSVSPGSSRDRRDDTARRMNWSDLHHAVIVTRFS
jgi:hypothetical protein